MLKPAVHVTVLSMIGLAATLTAQSVVRSAPAVRIDAVIGIADAFDSHDIVLVPGWHGSQTLHELLLATLRHHGFKAVSTTSWSRWETRGIKT